MSSFHAWHVFTLHNSSDLGFETHIQHSISLIKDKVFNVGERDSSSFHQVNQSTRSSREEIASSVEGSDLLSNVGTTVDDSRSDPRSVSKLSRLVVDLRNELSGGSKDQGGGIRLSSSVAHVGGRSRGTIAEHGGENGEEETTGLSGTSLSTSHQISATSYDGNGVFLDRGGSSVSSVTNVLQKDRVDRRVGELDDGLGHTVTGSLDRDIGVLVEVDTARLYNQQLSGKVSFT